MANTDQPTSSILAFPNEILDAVASSLDPASLNSLQQTNRRLCTVVAPHLHHAYLQQKDTILLWTARRNDKQGMQRAIELGAAVPFKHLLQESGANGWDNTARVVLDAGAYFVQKENDAVHRIFEAIWKGHLNVTRLMLERGALAEPQSIRYRSMAISRAVVADDIEMVQLLIAHGADMKSVIRPQSCFLTVIRQRNIAIMKAFLDAGMLADLTPYQGNGDPVNAVARHGSVEMMELLLRYGASVDTKGKYGDTPLHQTAMYAGRNEMRRLLLENGADMGVKNERGYTPLHTAVCRGNLPAVVMLLEYGADVGLVRLYQWEPVRARPPGPLSLGSREDVKRVFVVAGVVLDS